MSIYDGMCDSGGKIKNRCAKPATHYARECSSAWCAEHSLSFASPLRGTWAEVVEQFEARKRKLAEAIEAAEAGGQFLYCEHSVMSPRQMREKVARDAEHGWVTEPPSRVDPERWADAYEREAEEAAELAKSKRAKASAIRREMKRAAPPPQER